MKPRTRLALSYPKRAWMLPSSIPLSMKGTPFIFRKCHSFKMLNLSYLVVLSVAFDSLLMANTLRLVATALPKSTIQRLAQRHGDIFFRFGLVWPLTDIVGCSVLSDDESTKTGDLYIRSVCFSPDGKYLATGAEDKQIRVRHRIYSFKRALWRRFGT